MAAPNPTGKGLVPGAGGGPQPGAGRPPDEWKRMCREAVSRADRFAIAESVIENPDHPAWLGAYKFLTEQGFGKGAQPLEHSGSLELTSEEAAARIAEILKGTKS